jgi:hypothetical protein
VASHMEPAFTPGRHAKKPRTTWLVVQAGSKREIQSSDRTGAYPLTAEPGRDLLSFRSWFAHCIYNAELNTVDWDNRRRPVTERGTDFRGNLR